MVRVFESLSWILVVSIAIAATTARATESICQPFEEKSAVAAVDAYFNSNLLEHGTNAFARSVRDAARAQAKAFLGQRVADKRAELCAARLKLAQDIKFAAASYTASDCSAAAIVGLLDQYAVATAAAYDQNRQALSALLDNHLKQIKLKLFEIAKGSNAGVDGASGIALATATKEARFEWVKQEASKLGMEANMAWGATGASGNPLVQANLELAREAVHAKQERDAAKVRYHSDGKLSAICKAK